MVCCRSSPMTSRAFQSELRSRHAPVWAALLCVLMLTLHAGPAMADETLTSPQAFRLSIPPFFHADVAANAPIKVVGTIERNGKTYRLVRLPDPVAAQLSFLVDTEGVFEGSAVNSNGTRMGFSYHPKPDVRLISMQAPQPAPMTDDLATIPENPDLAPIPRLAACVTPIHRTLLPMVAETYMLGSGVDGDKIVTAQSAIRRCSEARVKAAVESAQGNADLREAIKTLYVKQMALADAYLPKGEHSKVTFREALMRTQSAYDEAWDRVRLEMNLAGMK